MLCYPTSPLPSTNTPSTTSLSSPHLRPPYNPNGPTNPIIPITTHTPFPSTCDLLAAPLNVATGTAFVACTAFVDSVKLGSELHVAPCATDTVVIVIAGRTGVEDLVDEVDGEVVRTLTTVAGAQLEIVAPSAAFTVDEDDLVDDDDGGAGKAVGANESVEMGIEVGR
jgi:hypothetical protein